MPNTLSDSQSSILRSIFSAAPDSAVINLESALAGEVARGGAMAEVHGLIAQEATNRRTRSLVFMPVMPLCKPGLGPSPRFPVQTPALLWAAVRATDPAAARAAEGLGPCAYDEERIFAADVCNSLCRTAAAGLRSREGCFTAAVALLDKAGGYVEPFAKLLDLAPLARRALTQMPDWMGRLTEERAVAIHLAYNDADDLADDGGPRLLDILCAHMTEPWRVLHLISAVMDRPTDRFAAASEVARFGEFLMGDIDQRLGDFRAYDPSGGRASGLVAATRLHLASMAIAEFETSLDISREGPWGARLNKQKQSIAQLAETRMSQIDKALDAALPVQMVKFGSGVRGFPKLDEDPQPPMLRKAQSLLAFFVESRASANQAGYASVRTKAGERLDSRLDHYVEDLLEMLRGEDVQNIARIKLYLGAAADLIAAARGEQAAAIIRRRAAA
ncbi:MAG TPA: hypothetical protein VGI79_06625 [Caulobacteraceae bacterium]|jgi:hypothetical protein